MSSVSISMSIGWFVSILLGFGMGVVMTLSRMMFSSVVITSSCSSVDSLKQEEATDLRNLFDLLKSCIEAERDRARERERR